MEPRHIHAISDEWESIHLDPPSAWCLGWFFALAILFTFLMDVMQGDRPWKNSFGN